MDKIIEGDLSWGELDNLVSKNINLQRKQSCQTNTL